MLAGCAGVPLAPPQVVEKPVYVPCVSGAPIVRPEFEFSKLGPAAGDGEKILALAREWPKGREYEGRLEAAVAGCR
jgi:hypothetical protein